MPGPSLFPNQGCIELAAPSSSPMTGLSSGVQSWVLIYKTVGMGEPGLRYLGSSSSGCKETAKQALKACISPDSRDVGLVFGAMGVSAMNSRARCISHGGMCGARYPRGRGTPHPVQLWALTWEQTLTSPRGRYRPCSHVGTESGRANSAMSHHVPRKAAEVTAEPAVRREAAGTDISAGTSSSKKQPHGAHCSEDTGKAGAALQSPSSLLARQNTHLLMLMLGMFLGVCPARLRTGKKMVPCYSQVQPFAGVTLTIDGGQDNT